MRLCPGRLWPLDIEEKNCNALDFFYEFVT
jgi:hypothetical protein